MDIKKLGFGTMRLPLMDETNQKSIDMKHFELMIDTFLEKGFTYFDTAYMYHTYRSEIAVREALVKRHPRNSFTLADKLPVGMLTSEEALEKTFNEQLEKCGVDYFDYYMLHNITNESYENVKSTNAFAFIRRKKSEGKIKKIGFSFHSSAELLEEIINLNPGMDFVQLQINYLDWDNESIQSGKCYETATRHHLPVIVMEPIKGGTLADIEDEASEILKKREPELSIASWAIRYVASLENVFMVLSGMSDINQLNDNTTFMSHFKPFEKEDYQAINQVIDIINKSISIPCTACRYCTDGCPLSIAIPEYFALYNSEKQSLNKGFSTQSVYYENLIKTHGRASECIECGQCEAICPQHIDIINQLKNVASIFENEE